MEKVNKKFSTLMMLILVIILSLIGINKFITYNYEYTITVIYNEDEKIYNNLIKEGIDLAGYEMGIVINYVNYFENINNVLKDEYKNSDGFIVLEMNKDSILDLKNIQKPIIFLGEDLELKPNTNISYINSDSQKIGEYIADEILKNGNTRENIIFIKDKNCLQSEKNMHKSFIDIINLSNNTIEEVIFEEVNLENLMEETKSNIFVTFEPYILNELCEIKIKNDNLKNKQIYGLSKGNERIKYLENDILKGAIVKNEFSLGYLSVNNIKRMVQKKPYNIEKINFNIINKRNMYLKENQYLLFPFN